MLNYDLCAFVSLCGSVNFFAQEVNLNRSTKPKSIALSNNAQRVYRTYEDWESEQKRDTRSPEERGIKVGSSVMWRHRTENGVIVTDRAMVLAINEQLITLQVKDVQEHSVEVHVNEIVTTDDGSSR